MHRLAERVAGRHPALVHRGRRQRGEADDVADGVDVVDLGLECLVDEDPPSVVGFQARVTQLEVFGLTLPARGVHHRFGGDLLAAGQTRDGARPADLHAGHLFAEAERDRQVAQVEPQGLDDFGIAEIQHVLPLLDDGHLAAQRGEHRRVLDADHAGADHHHRCRDRLEIEDAVGVQHTLLVEFHAFGAGRLGAGGDDDVLAADRGALATGAIFDEQGVLVAEPGFAGDEINSVAHQLISHHIGLLADDVAEFATAGRPG